MKRISNLFLLLVIILSGCGKVDNSDNSSQPTNTPSSTESSNGDTSEDIPSTLPPVTSEETTTLPNSEEVTSEIPSTTLPPVTSEEESSLPGSSEPLPSEVSAYYAGVDFDLSGDQLKSALYNKIKAHTTHGYSSLNNIMKITDRDWNLSPDRSDSNPYMVLIYGTYNFKTGSAKRHGTQNDIWDKEHIWAKSHGDFGTSNGAGSDLHHLRASDKYNNNNRGSLDFGRVDNFKKWVKDNKGTGENSGKIGSQKEFSGTDVYEPMDIYKGDVARAIFYMATRYSVGSPLLLLADQPTGRTGSPGYHGILSTLLEWNEIDPVDEFEFNRNGLVQEYQKNRNPFIDYPYLAEKIWA